MDTYAGMRKHRPRVKAFDAMFVVKDEVFSNEKATCVYVTRQKLLDFRAWFGGNITGNVAKRGALFALLESSNNFADFSVR